MKTSILRKSFAVQRSAEYASIQYTGSSLALRQSLRECKFVLCSVLLRTLIIREDDIQRISKDTYELLKPLISWMSCWTSSGVSYRRARHRPRSKIQRPPPGRGLPVDHSPVPGIQESRRESHGPLDTDSFRNLVVAFHSLDPFTCHRI